MSGALVLVQDGGQVWRVTLRDRRERLVSVDVPKGLAAHVRDGVQKYLGSQS